MKSFKKWAMAPVLVASSMMATTPAHATIDPYLGEVVPYAFNFCPRGWTEASGQTLNISLNTALFSLLGTTYGGNGQTTFALPDLRGRVGIGIGQGPGLSNIDQGEVSGQETVTILANQLPSHTHSGQLRANSAAGNTNVAVGNRLAMSPTNAYDILANPTNFMHADTITSAAAGSAQPASVMKPYVVMRHCIAMQGIFPSRP